MQTAFHIRVCDVRVVDFVFNFLSAHQFETSRLSLRSSPALQNSEDFQSRRSEMIVECVSNKWTHISDNFIPKAKVFNLLSAWMRALLSITNCVNGSSHQHTVLSPPQILETRTSGVRKDRSFGIGSRYCAIGHEMIFV